MGDGMLSLAWNNHSSTFCHMLSTLRGMERYTDVTVACEGKFYEVHKLVLASCSDYFLRMFEKTPCKHPIVVLKDIQGKDIEALLSYMYDGIVSVAQNDLARLINAAEVLQIKGLAVPDDPPFSNKKSTVTRSASDDRSSPQAKRARRDDNSSAQKQRSRETSPHSIRSASELVTTKKTLSDRLNVDRNRKVCDAKDSYNNGPKSDINDNRAEKDRQNSSNDQELQVKVLEENDIKEETDDIQESEYDFGMVEQINMENISSDDLGNKNINLGFSSPGEHSFDSQAGPSGLQTWTGLQEGDLSNQSYPDINLDAPVGGQPTSHQQPQHLMSMMNWANTEVEGTTEPGSLRRANSIFRQYPQLDDNEAFRPSQRDAAGVKMYPCPHCPYRTGFKGNLSKHLRIHTGEKPYSCPYCQYATSFKNNLNRHILIHQTMS